MFPFNSVSLNLILSYDFLPLNIFRYFRFSLVLWDPNIYNEHFNLTINSPSSDRLSPVVRLSIYSPNPRGQFQLKLVQSILDWILYKWKTTPFSSRNNYEMPNIYWRNFKIFNRTTVPVSSKLGEMHPFGVGIQVCSNEGPRVLWGEGINNKLAKKILSSRFTLPISTKLDTKRPCVKAI